MTNTPTLLDQLDFLLSGIEGPAAPAGAVTEAPGRAVTTVQAVTLGPPAFSPAAPACDPAKARAAAEEERRRTARDSLMDESIQASREALAVIRQAFADKEADFDDAVKALPAVHRIVEHAEKLEASRKLNAGGWPPLNFTIMLGASDMQVPPPPRVKEVLHDVIELDPGH